MVRGSHRLTATLTRDSGVAGVLQSTDGGGVDEATDCRGAPPGGRPPTHEPAARTASHRGRHAAAPAREPDAQRSHGRAGDDRAWRCAGADSARPADCDVRSGLAARLAAAPTVMRQIATA